MRTKRATREPAFAGSQSIWHTLRISTKRVCSPTGFPKLGDIPQWPLAAVQANRGAGPLPPEGFRAGVKQARPIGTVIALFVTAGVHGAHRPQQAIFFTEEIYES